MANLFRLAAHFDRNCVHLVSMEYFSDPCSDPKQLEDVINCSHKLKEDIFATSFSGYCSIHPQDLFCKQCGVDVCMQGMYVHD